MRELRAQWDGEDTQTPTAAEAPPLLVGWVGGGVSKLRVEGGAPATWGMPRGIILREGRPLSESIA